MRVQLCKLHTHWQPARYGPLGDTGHFAPDRANGSSTCENGTSSIRGTWTLRWGGLFLPLLTATELQEAPSSWGRALKVESTRGPASLSTPRSAGQTMRRRSGSSATSPGCTPSFCMWRSRRRSSAAIQRCIFSFTSHSPLHARAQSRSARVRLVMKFLACIVWRKPSREQLSNRPWIRPLAQAHTPIMRAIEAILQRRGFEQPAYQKLDTIMFALTMFVFILFWAGMFRAVPMPLRGRHLAGVARRADHSAQRAVTGLLGQERNHFRTLRERLSGSLALSNGCHCRQRAFFWRHFPEEFMSQRATGRHHLWRAALEGRDARASRRFRPLI